MNAMKIVLIMFLSAALLGCKEDVPFEEAVKRIIEQDVKNIYADINSTECSQTIVKLISSSPDNLARINLFTQWGNAVLAAKMPIQTNDFYFLSRVVDRVEDRIRSEIVRGLQTSEAGEEVAFEMQFRLIQWLDERLKELFVISKRIEKDENQCMMWRNCYRKVFSTYRSNINMLEYKWFPVDLDFRNVSQVIKERIRVNIEKFLGRKMRTPDEVRSNWNWETEIYQKVDKYQLP